MDNDTSFFLWVDPQREQGYNLKTFDLEAFLGRAVALFQTKERWKGQKPRAVKVHPDQEDNSLESAAKALGLEVVHDPTVQIGTYQLGLAQSQPEEEDDLGRG